MISRRLRLSRLRAAAALVLLFAHAAYADVADGGAPADAASAATVTGTVTDAAAAPVTDAAPPPAELAKPPELTAVSSTAASTAMLTTPAPPDAEPPRPITRRLWFWMAVTGVVVGAVLIGIAVNNPNHTRPGCPPDYVCPL